MLGSSCNPCCDRCTCTTIESLSVAVHWGISNLAIASLSESGVNQNDLYPTGFNSGQPRYPLGVINPFSQIGPSGTAYTVPRVQPSVIEERFDIFVSRALGRCYYFYEDVFGGVTITNRGLGTQALGVRIYIAADYSQNIPNQVTFTADIRFAGLMIANLFGDPYVDGFLWTPTGSHMQGCQLSSAYVPYSVFNTRTLSSSYGAGAFPQWSAGLTIANAANPLP